MNQNQEQNPLQINLLSDDQTLPMALGSVLGPEFVIVTTPLNLDGKEQMEFDGQAEVLILDIDRQVATSSARAALIDELFDSLMGTGLPVIVMASDESHGQADDLVERGALGYVRKPPAIREFKALLRSAMESRRLKRLEAGRGQLENLTGLDALIGSSEPMQFVYRLIRKVANLDASVLITGESGTGKELISRAIHHTGARAKRPFVAVSCSAIPETLIESELFGHEKGAFTGSNGTHIGSFEQAGDGTLFLDEIGELTPQIQVKLLRVLQQREFSRLGSSRTIPLRARVILATHRNLQRMVAEGQFREDLFYRINVVNIPAPELRRRVSDIPALVQHFERKYAALFCKPLEGIRPDALALLQSYPWPGNVRELENVVQRAIILTEEDSIQVHDLPEEIREAEVECDGDLQPNGTFDRLLRDYKSKIATDAVQRCQGSKTLAAQSLSISRAYLHRLLRPPASAPDTGLIKMRNRLCA